MVSYKQLTFLVLALTVVSFFDAKAVDKVKTRQKYGAELSATGEIYAKIVAPVAATSSNDLRFGTIVTNNAGDVTVDEEGNRTTTGPGLATSGYSSGAIHLSGPRAQAVSVAIPGAHIYDNDDNSINVHSFTTSADSDKLITLGSQDGKADINIGATLNVSDTAKSGVRSGVYRIQTSY